MSFAKNNVPQIKFRPAPTVAPDDGLITDAGHSDTEPNFRDRARKRNANLGGSAVTQWARPGPREARTPSYPVFSLHRNQSHALLVHQIYVALRFLLFCFLESRKADLRTEVLINEIYGAAVALDGMRMACEEERPCKIRFAKRWTHRGYRRSDGL